MQPTVNSSENAKLANVKGTRLNPFNWIENGIRERRLKKQKKMLQMKLAVISGGITRMK